jgi:hypothetical protein
MDFNYNLKARMYKLLQKLTFHVEIIFRDLYKIQMFIALNGTNLSIGANIPLLPLTIARVGGSINYSHSDANGCFFLNICGYK